MKNSRCLNCRWPYQPHQGHHRSRPLRTRRLHRDTNGQPDPVGSRIDRKLRRGPAQPSPGGSRKINKRRPHLQRKVGFLASSASHTGPAALNLISKHPGDLPMVKTTKSPETVGSSTGMSGATDVSFLFQ